MNAYQVIWKADHDEMQFTTIYTARDPDDLELQDWVTLAAIEDGSPIPRYFANIEFIGVLPDNVEWVA